MIGIGEDGSPGSEGLRHGPDPFRGSPEWQKHWRDFTVTFQDRLQAGFREYGDHSFERQPSDLLREMEQEALDIMGWGFILWVRLRGLQAAVVGSGHV